ncbi:MAG TPA: hypothetical protein VG228_09420 [Solirubrobacteraceae bacterium]|jgi:hypothetical protein|nr:hypothetical protein [Solirubrobacteraceae bacterium]
MFRSSFVLPRVAAAMAAATLIAACGGSGSHPSTTVGGSPQISVNGVRMTVAQANAAMIRFATCMRRHGVNGLPSPISSPAAFKHSFTTTTPAYTSAMGTCQRLLPGQQSNRQSAAQTQKQIHAMLAFARCVRGHGFPRFPDPTSTGELNHQMLAQAGIDLHQPAVVQAADACASVTHGVITRAIVTRFIAGE